MTKKEKETMLDEKKEGLKEILENISLEDACYLIMHMKEEDVDSVMFTPQIFPIDDFDEVLSGWNASDVLRMTSQEFSIDYDKFFYIDDFGYICNEDDYVRQYYYADEAYEFLKENDFTEETGIDSIDYWEEEYHELKDKLEEE